MNIYFVYGTFCVFILQTTIEKCSIFVFCMTQLLHLKYHGLLTYIMFSSS